MPQIMRLLLSSLTMEAKLSLEALLDLVAVLARDLQEQYLPYFPKVMARSATDAGTAATGAAEQDTSSPSQMPVVVLAAPVSCSLQR